MNRNNKSFIFRIFLLLLITIGLLYCMKAGAVSPGRVLVSSASLFLLAYCAPGIIFSLAYFMTGFLLLSDIHFLRVY